MVKNTVKIEANSIKNVALAYRSHKFFCEGCSIFDALKYAIVVSIEVTKASNTKKCPIFPGNKCSPSNVMTWV